MNKLELNELKKLDEYSPKQIKTLMSSKNDLDDYAYPFVKVKELKVIDKVLTKIKKHKELLDAEEETNKEAKKK